VARTVQARVVTADLTSPTFDSGWVGYPIVGEVGEEGEVWFRDFGCGTTWRVELDGSGLLATATAENAGRPLDVPPEVILQNWVGLSGG